MNGHADTRVERHSVEQIEHTPLAYYQPIAITPAVIKWIVGGVIAAIWSLQASGWLFLPAKDSELQALVRVVQTVQSAQDESRKAVERLTLAVDNLSGLVAEIKRPQQIFRPKARR
jgi:hypothetical protein